MAPHDISAPREAAVRSVIDNWLDGLRAKDAVRVVGQFGPDPVHFTLAPPLLSETASADALNGWFATWDGPLDYEVRDLAIAADGGIAFAHALCRMSGTKVGGERVSLWYRQTWCLRSRDGAWKIVHGHQSVPFYMDGSYRAAIDLEP